MIKNISIFYCFLLLVICCCLGCKKELDDECPNCPKVFAITPNMGHFGDTVLISGINLMPNEAYNDVLQVKFNGVAIAQEYILENYEDSIRLIIPKGTSSGPVTVDINIQDGLTGTVSAPFTYLTTPLLTLFSGIPNVGPGSTIGPFLETSYDYPTDISVDESDNVYVMDYGNNRIVKLDLTLQEAIVVASPLSGNINCMTVSLDTLYYSVFNNSNNVSTIFKIGGTSIVDPTTYRAHSSMAQNVSGELYVSRYTTNLGTLFYDIYKIPPYNFSNNTGLNGEILCYQNNKLYFVSNHFDPPPVTSTMHVYSETDSSTTQILGPGSGLSFIRGFVVRNPNEILISNGGNGSVYQSNATGNLKEIFTGLNQPSGMALDSKGNIYLAESGNHSIWKLTFE